MNLAHVAGLWEENQEFLKQRLGHSTSERLGARWVLMPEAPFPRFNHVSCVRLPAEGISDLLEEGRAFFRQHRLPASSIMTTPATEPVDLDRRLTRLGFTMELNPVMVHDGSAIDLSRSESVRIEVASMQQQELVFSLIHRVFLPGANPATQAAGRRGVGVSWDIGATHFVAYIGNRPAGTGMLFPRGAMGGVYNMCTMPEFRGHGVATALVNACLEESRRLGCRYTGLTPTAMGRPLYEELGFYELYQERYFVERLG